MNSQSYHADVRNVTADNMRCRVSSRNISDL